MEKVGFSFKLISIIAVILYFDWNGIHYLFVDVSNPAWYLTLNSMKTSQLLLE